MSLHRTFIEQPADTLADIRAARGITPKPGPVRHVINLDAPYASLVLMCDGMTAKTAARRCVICDGLIPYRGRSRATTCDEYCLAELGRRNAAKRWTHRGAAA